MKRGFLCALIAGIFALPAEAALKNGAAAPMFTTQASFAGEEFTFSLTEALKNGPVVLFFYPKAFTRGCTVEAHNFAQASEQFKALGATVLGVSNDNIKTLNKFSVEACQNKVAVAADDSGKIIKAYDAALLFSYAKRISFVIAPDGNIIYSYTALDPDLHVTNTMDAVKKWRASQG
jgi:thioredoxin-dependent peroxiredoxin